MVSAEFLVTQDHYQAYLLLFGMGTQCKRARFPL